MKSREDFVYQEWELRSRSSHDSDDREMADPALTTAGGTRSRAAPRWHIDSEALDVLERLFDIDRFPNVETRKRLGTDLNVSPRQIQVWFQNRRQRERKHKEHFKTKIHLLI